MNSIFKHWMSPVWIRHFRRTGVHHRIFFPGFTDNLGGITMCSCRWYQRLWYWIWEEP